MTASNRTDKLFSALSARERAVMMLRAWKAGTEPDPQIKATIPPAEVRDYNQLIDLMNDAHGMGAPLVLLIRAKVERLGTLEGWIFTLKAWGMDVFQLGLHIFSEEPEPITRSEYDRLKKKSRKRDPKPDWGLRYEILPDTQADEVARRRASRERVRQVIRDLPWSPDPELFDPEATDRESIHSHLIDRLAEGFQTYWGEMLAVETFLAESAQSFDGEEPALPPIRASLDWVRSELLSVQANLKKRHLHEVETPGPNEEMLEVLRDVLAGFRAVDGAIDVDFILEKLNATTSETPTASPGHTNEP